MTVHMQDCMSSEVVIQNEDCKDGKTVMHIYVLGRKEPEKDIYLTREQVEEFIDALRFVGKRV